MTIRIAQTELGQGVWTSNAMMVCEELQCDWTKVRPQYASANRDAREKAPEWTLKVMGQGATDPKGGGEPTFGNRDRTGVAGIPDSLYRRMRTNAASSVKDGRYYLQLAGAEARERLLLAAAALWSVPVAELTARNSIITHASSGRTTTYGQIAHRAAETPHPHPETITIKPPDQWTLMGTEQKNLDVPLKVTGKTVYAIDVRVPGMKWAAVKACPVYGGDVKSYDFDAIRTLPGVRSAVQFPIPDPALTRGRVFSGGVAVIADTWYQAKTALDRMPIEWNDSPRARRVHHGEHARSPCWPRSIGPAACASIRAMSTRPSRAPPRSSRRRTRRRICRARAWSLATPRCSSPAIAWTSGSAIRAPRKRASAPRRSPESPSRTSICTCATWAEASAATATGPRPSRRS